MNSTAGNRFSGYVLRGGGPFDGKVVIEVRRLGFIRCEYADGTVEIYEPTGQPDSQHQEFERLDLKAGEPPLNSGLLKAAEPLLYTAEEASILLGRIYSPYVLKRLAGEGKIDCTRYGRFVRWSRKNLDQIIADWECTAANYGRRKKRR